MPAPKVMMPAGGAVPKWGHCHGGIISELPTSNIGFEPTPFIPNSVGGQPTNPSMREGFPPLKGKQVL